MQCALEWTECPSNGIEIIEAFSALRIGLRLPLPHRPDFGLSPGDRTILALRWHSSLPGPALSRPGLPMRPCLSPRRRSRGCGARLALSARQPAPVRMRAPARVRPFADGRDRTHGLVLAPAGATKALEQCAGCQRLEAAANTRSEAVPSKQMVPNVEWRFRCFLLNIAKMPTTTHTNPSSMCTANTARNTAYRRAGRLMEFQFLPRT